nr:hypothetical protein [Tanacetum cinerariifolium]
RKKSRKKREATRAEGPVRDPVTAPIARECSFAGFMKCGPTQFHRTEGAVGLVRWFEKMENTFKISECAKVRKVKFATSTLHGRALTWWNSQVVTLGREVANARSWAEVKQMMTDEFCPTEEVQRFNELALLCPDAVPNEKKKVELYIKGLPEIIKGETTSSRPITLNEAVRMAHALMEQKIQSKNERIAEGLKRKWENNNRCNNNNSNNNNNHNRGNYQKNNHHNQNNNRRQNNARALTTAQNTGANQAEVAPKFCYSCRERGHKSSECPKKADQRGGNVQGQAYVIRDAEHNQGPNVVTARKYIERGSQLFLAQVTETEPVKKQLQDVLVICNFLEVFPDDLPGLPPPRQVEFKIELIPGATPVARAPYRLAPSELKELSDQLKKLSSRVLTWSENEQKESSTGTALP